MSPPKARRITPFVTIPDGMARYFLIFECGTIAAATPQRVGKRMRLRRMVSAPSTIIAIVFDGSPRLRQPRGEADPPSVAGLHAIRLPLQRIGLPTFPVRAKQPPHESDRATVIQRLLQRTDSC